jgi:hypothetical protein
LSAGIPYFCKSSLVCKSELHPRAPTPTLRVRLMYLIDSKEVRSLSLATIQDRYCCLVSPFPGEQEHKVSV